MDDQKDTPRNTRPNPPSGSASRGRPEPKLSFTPITDGLGFHPFSDGLPYAPIAKSGPGTSSERSSERYSERMTRGSGAVTAGPPTFASPIPRPKPLSSPVMPPGRVSVPVAQSPQSSGLSSGLPAGQSSGGPSLNLHSRPQAPGAGMIGAGGISAHSVIAPVKTRPQPLPPKNPPIPQKSANELLIAVPAPGVGYLFKRLFAYLFDSVLNLGLCTGTLILILRNQGLNPDSLLSADIWLPFCLFLFVFNWAIIAAQEVAFGTSVGKRLFGLALNGNAAALFLRAFFFLPSLAFGGLGIVWALFDRNRRGWHDLVVDVQPTEIAQL